MKLSNRSILLLVSGFLLLLVLIGVWLHLRSRSSNGESAPAGGDYLSADWQDEGMVLRVTADNLYWNPEVVQLEDGTYRMYCESSDDGGKSWRVVAFASSDGKSWKLKSVVLDDANMPAVVKLPDGRWRLYFNDFKSFESGGTEGFGSATSLDGLNFKREAGLRLSPKGEVESGGIRHPTAVALPDDGFRIYYEARGGSKDVDRILSASSADGLEFTRDEGVRIDATAYDAWMSASSPSVLRTPEGKWIIFYARGYNPKAKSQQPMFGKLGICLATSEDGLSFSIKDEAEIKQEELSDGQYAPTDPAALLVDGESDKTLWLWYYQQILSGQQFGEHTGVFLAKKAYEPF